MRISNILIYIYIYSCNFNDERLEVFDQKIEQIEHQIHHIEEHLERTNEKFVGIAFVSFETEDMKD